MLPEGDLLLLIFGEVVGDRLTTDDGFEPFWDLVMFDVAADFRSLISYGLKLTLSFCIVVGDVVVCRVGWSETIKAGLLLPFALKLLPRELLSTLELLVFPLLLFGLVDPRFDDNVSFEFKFDDPLPDFSTSILLLP